jgi:signal transduction histidine kinase
MKTRPIFSRSATYFFTILIAIAFTLVLIELIMHPPSSDLLGLGVLLTITGLISAILGFLSHRLEWWRHLRSIHYAMTLGYLLAAGLTMFNVWLTAKLMFINDHDLALGTMLLIFAAVISVSIGYFLSRSITQRLGDLVGATQKLSEGDFSIRVPVTGQDEVAQLASTFNEVVARLEEAERAERALDEARRNLVAWASHDLRTPLTSLRAMIDALVEGVVDDPDSIARYLQQSQVEINRMSALVNDLFEVVQLDTGLMELHCSNSSLADLISDTLQAFSARAQKRGVELTGAVEPEVDPVWMAPEKISRVLQNLVSNAIRYTPTGGRVHIQAGSTSHREVTVTIVDSGAGIPADELPKVFDRFYRGEVSRARNGSTHGGAGLGLTIAKGLVEAHGGQIYVRSKLDEGSVFSFTLPKQEQASVRS